MHVALISHDRVATIRRSTTFLDLGRAWGRSRKESTMHTAYMCSVFKSPVMALSYGT